LGKFTYDYPRPAVTVDLAVFTLDVDVIRVLMVRRGKEPFAGRWAFPGGFVNIDEPFDIAARRELKEETGLEASGPIEFIGVFGKPGRDPRGRTISIAHATVVRGPLPRVKGGDDAAEAAWLKFEEAKNLAFDHDEILAAARGWLRQAVILGPAGVGLLPVRFTERDVLAVLKASFSGMKYGGDDLNVHSWIEGMHEDKLVGKGRKKGVFVARTLPAYETQYRFPF
jgi:8-oxo-dGTP diphosphatase